MDDADDPSILARLGKDPWTEAARWRELPMASATECLAQSIARMLLGAQSLASARTTAAELIRLLPPPHRLTTLRGRRSDIVGTTRIWVSTALMACALILGLAMNAMLLPSKSRLRSALLVTLSKAHQRR
jgi:hypothetical protein